LIFSRLIFVLEPYFNVKPSTDIFVFDMRFTDISAVIKPAIKTPTAITQYLNIASHIAPARNKPKTATNFATTPAYNGFSLSHSKLRMVFTS